MRLGTLGSENDPRTGDQQIQSLGGNRQRGDLKIPVGEHQVIAPVAAPLLLAKLRLHNLKFGYQQMVTATLLCHQLQAMQEM